MGPNLGNMEDEDELFFSSIFEEKLYPIVLLYLSNLLKPFYIVNTLKFVVIFEFEVHKTV
jgi:hypothetical protein